MTQERHWIDNVADLVSGRIHNTFVSLTDRIAEMENIMTQNEQTILDAARTLNEAKTRLDEGIQALKDRIDASPGVSQEDLSEELAVLQDAIGGIGNTVGNLSPVAGGTPATPGETPGINPNEDGGTPIGGPITHDPNAQPDPLAGASGGTDAGVPTEPQQPGTGANDSPLTPVAEDAQAEANPNLPPSDESIPDPVVPVGDGTDVEDDEDDEDEDVDPDAEVDADEEDEDDRI